MIKRKIQQELAKLAQEYKVVTITGPRQSGKTTLARMQFPDYNYVNLEEPETRQLAERDAKEFLKRYSTPIIIDEIQRLPMLLSYIQVECDKSSAKGQYILTGSHQPALKAEVAQSLAGRTAILQLLPLSIEELTEAGIQLDRDEYLFKGFMPQLYEENIDITRFYRNYYMTYVERDARQLVNIRNFSSFEIFIKLLAGRVGQLVNLNSLAGDVGVSSSTLGEWLSILEASYIVFRLLPYFENFGKRLIKTPKLYFTEVGLAAYLLDLENPGMVTRDPLMGNLFENMVIVEALKARYNAGKDAGLYFFRDSNGLEIDLLQSANRKLYPMEIKAARTYNSDFAVNIRKFEKLNDKTAGGSVIYSGDNVQKIGDIQLLNFMDTAGIVH
ncbi:ATP-binding protein [Victivallis sp. Marseille-Q1083]|uniref:ATP-binding protein n=1 Tax=Victivallis sp. Marseille-Q1083 TaxID=2717288 RepID=UPI001589A959|nr:ATP-binding protein [Victivallis sp. Marseille-Q1083]